MRFDTFVRVGIVMIALLPGIVLGARIYGTVYDLSLHKVEGAVISVNSTPQQRVVAEDGTYAVEVPEGIYLLSVSQVRGSTNYTAKETLTIVDDGTYVLDLFLYPDIEDDFEDFEIPPIEIESDHPYFLIILVSVALAILPLFIFRKRLIPQPKAKPRQADGAVAEDLQEILDILQRHGGRLSQRDIRKEVGLSEAKISLMVAELEHLGLVMKIKKGRGNIISLR